jgi:histidinol dehydrogenase
VAPEHLSIPVANVSLIQKLSEAGSVFLGPWSAQPIGDYASGTNHVLPTSGWAATRGGLSVSDFVKCSSTQEISRQGLKRLAPVVSAMARAEGLEAHARAVEVRE